MTIADRLRTRSDVVRAATRPRAPGDVLFTVAVCVLSAVHLTIFIATMVLAPVTPSEARGAELLHLPVEVARAVVLPFHALLLVSLYILGRRAAGRWAGFGAMLALLALNLRADPSLPIYGPPTAGGIWIAAALLAVSLVVVRHHRLAAAALLGAAVCGDGRLLLALPAFLVAIAVYEAEWRSRLRAVGSFAAVWVAVVALGQVVWIGSVGVDGWLDRVAEGLAPLRPHDLVPFLEQQRILFAAWHFPALLTFVLATTLFTASGIGLAKYFFAGHGPIATRLPVELWAAVLTTIAFAVLWAFSGATAVIEPNLPALAAIAPLLTPMAYRGAKWLFTINRFWRLVAVVYLTGLISARSLQLVLTLIDSFHT